MGLMLDESIELNISIAALKTKNRFVVKKCGIPFYDKKSAVEYAKQMIKELDIRCTGYTKPVRRKLAEGMYCKSADFGTGYPVCIRAYTRH